MADKQKLVSAAAFFVALPLLVALIFSLFPIGCPEESKEAERKAAEEKTEAFNIAVAFTSVVDGKTEKGKRHDDEADSKLKRVKTLACTWSKKWVDDPVVLFTYYIFLVTTALAFYTYMLWGATNDLVERTEFTTRVQERAYIYGGGPYGELREDITEEQLKRGRQRASYYKPPWCMAVYNMGRTPGTITKVEWGLIEDSKFPKGHKMATLLKHRDKYFPPDTIKEVEFPNFICPPTDIPGLYFRHVDFKTRRVGDVFFAKVEYEDIFGTSHWSAFKLRFTEDHSDPIDGGYEQDYEKPPTRRT